MKKILFLLVLIYNFAFASVFSVSSSAAFAQLSNPYVYITDITSVRSYGGYKIDDKNGARTAPNGGTYQTKAIITPTSIITFIPTYYGDNATNKPCNYNVLAGFEGGVGLCSNGNYSFFANPANGTFGDDGNLNCNSGYSATGIALGIPACMPNPENGTWDDNDDLVCNEGYVKNNDNSACELSSGTNTGGIDTDPNNTWQKALDESKANGTYSVSNNGTQDFTVGGINYNLTANGVLTTTYPDGSSSVQQVSWSGGSGGSSGGTGTSGGSGTSGGGTGNTTNENNTTPPTDTPIDNTPVANSCSDSGLTLQEKMLCELNAGMKKQNSENAPENSLNQLLKDLKNSNQTDNTALNTNIKNTNNLLTGVKALNETQVNKQTEANATLEKINDSANATELYTKVISEGINKIIGDDSTPTPDMSDLNNSSSWINGVFDEYTTFYNNLKDSGNSFTAFANNAKDTINQGFTFNVSSSQMVNCPLDYVIDLSSLGQENININVDFCAQTSKLRPYLYPFILIILFISIIFFTLSFVRGL